MTSEIDRSVDNDTCLKLSRLGYARSNHVRLYGQELQIVSDPFLHDDGGIAVEVVGDSDRLIDARCGCRSRSSKSRANGRKSKSPN